ncbi:MAG TPA: DUF1559 domain-containing protein [Chthoniobacteraceae bacterium]|nr:DUF1559 domain-containing protein [Chthoniobacteraceae bacterium]
MLVVIGTALVLLGLILPAIMQSRRSAQLMTCSVRLKQIGIAVANFEAQEKRYPRAFCGNVERPEFGKKSYCFSPQAELLPYLDALELAEKIDWADVTTDSMGQPPSPGTNTEALASRIAAFLCPADPSKSTGTNYRFCRGVTLDSQSNRPGLFTGYSAHAPASAHDGLAKTAMCSERTIGVADSDSTAYLLEESASFFPDCATKGRSSPQDPYWGTTFLRGSPRMCIYLHLFPPNYTVRDCSIGTDMAITARSNHTGGVNLLFADGHVEFISDAIDLRLWHAAATRDGREVQAATP